MRLAAAVVKNSDLAFQAAINRLNSDNVTVVSGSTLTPSGTQYNSNVMISPLTVVHDLADAPTDATLVLEITESNV